MVKAAYLESRRSWFRAPLWRLSFKEKNVSSPLTPKDSILWGASVTGRWCARPQTPSSRVSNPVSGGQSHHPQDILLAQFSLYVHKGALKPYSFYFISPCVVCRLSRSWARTPLGLICNNSRPYLTSSVINVT